MATPLLVAAAAPLYAAHDLTGDGYVEEDEDAFYENADYEAGVGGTWNSVSSGGTVGDGRGGSISSLSQYVPSSDADLQQPSVVQILLLADPYAASVPDGMRRLPLAVALDSGKTWDRGGVKEILDAHPDAIMARDPKSGLYPFMSAAMDRSNRRGLGADDTSMTYTIYELLQANPELVRLGLPDGVATGKAEERLRRPLIPDCDKKLSTKLKGHQHDGSTLDNDKKLLGELKVWPVQSPSEKGKRTKVGTSLQNALKKSST